MVIRQTDRTSALFDMQEEGRLRFLYTNKAYRKQIQALGYQLQDIEENLSFAEKSEISQTFHDVINRSRQSHQAESFCYIDGGSYVNVRLRVVYAMNHHLLVHVEFQNISRSSASSTPICATSTASSSMSASWTSSRTRSTRSTYREA